MEPTPDERDAIMALVADPSDHTARPEQFDGIHRLGPVVRLTDRHVYVSGHAAAMELLRDPAVRPWMTSYPDAAAGGDAASAERAPLIDFFEQTMGYADPARHAVLRSAFNPWLSPQAVQRREGALEAIWERLDERIRSHGTDRPFDYVAQVSRWWPGAVIGAVMELDADDHVRITRLGETLSSALADRLDTRAFRRSSGAWVLLQSYFRRLVHRRREAPGEDMISAVAADERLRDEEIIANLVFVFMAATLITPELLSASTVMAVRDPRVRDALRDPGGCEGAVEEILRLHPPVSQLLRRAETDLEVEGRSIPAGSFLQIDIRSANRDPLQFADPAAFDPERSGRRALTFGFGPRHCIGWALARAEIRVLLSNFWTTYADTGFAVDPVPRKHLFQEAYERVELRLR